MKRLLFFIFVLLGSLTVKGQTFTFECICDYVTAADSNCDICNTNIQSRLFKGILIRKNATAFKWIDQPYIVQFQGNNATFKELIPNGETITITLAGTPFDSIPQYQDSIKCPCAGSDNFFIAGPGIYFSGDTISAFDVSPVNELQFVDSFYISAGNLYVSLDRDSVAASFVTLPVPTGAETIVTAGTGISVTGIGTSGSPYVVTNTLPHIGTDLTYSGTSSPLTLNSSTGSDVTNTAGTGISLTGTSSNMTITNTAPDQPVSITGAGINVVTGTYPNFTITGTEVDGSVTNELDSKWTDAGAYTYLTATADRLAVGSASSPGAKVTITGEGTGYGSALTIEDSGGTDRFIVQDNGNVGVGSYFPSGHTVGSGYRALWMDVSNSGLIAETATNYKGLNIVSNVVRNGGGWAQQDAARNSFIFSVGYESLNNGATLYRAAAGLGGSFSVLAKLGETNNYFTLPVGIANTSPQRTLHVTGEARITDLTTDTPTGVVGADADGDLGLLAFSGMSIVSGTLTATDGSTTNELQTYGHTGTTSYTNTLSNSGGSFTLQAGGINAISHTAGTVTITATEVDGSVTNELQTYGHAGTTTYTNTLSSGGGSWSITGAGIAAISQTGGAITVTATEVDGSITNEGVLGVGAGGASSSTLLSTTSGANAVTINAAGILAITESPSANGGSITLTATEVDGSTSNELQTLANTSSATTHTVTLSNSGGSVQFAEGTGITLTTTGTTADGVVTIASTGLTSATGYINGGNSFGAAATIGLNDNFDWAFETNGTTRGWIDNAGTYTIGSSILTTAALNISGLQNNIGMHVAGGSSLTGPVMIQTRGNGSGSTCTVLDAQHSFLNGNVEALIQNTSTTGTGGALLTLNVDESATGDPKVYYTTAGTTDWAHGIDNSASGEPFRLTHNSDIGSGTSTITANTSNQVGINQNTPTVQLQVSGTDGIGFPQGTTAQRPTTPAFPVLRWNSTFSGFEVWDPNKSYWYRLTCVSTPTIASNTAAGTGHSSAIVSGAGSNDVRGAIELTTGSASLSAGTVLTVTYASAYSGTLTNVILTPRNDAAVTDIAKWRIDSQTQNGFTVRAVSALTASTTYQFNYYVGQ